MLFYIKTTKYNKAKAVPIYYKNLKTFILQPAFFRSL